MTSRRPAPGAPGLARLFSAYGQEIVIACAIVALFVIVSAINPRFLGANNLNTIVSGNAYIAVAAIGMSMIIITGHIDVSVGALIGVLASDLRHPRGLRLPGLVRLDRRRSSSAPAINGLVGALVAYGRLPSIVVTLGMLSILRGDLVFVTGGAWINDLPPTFQLAQTPLVRRASADLVLLRPLVAAAPAPARPRQGTSAYAADLLKALADIATGTKSLDAALGTTGLAAVAAEMARTAEDHARHFTHPGPARDDAIALFWQVAPAAFADPATFAAAHLDPALTTDRMVAAIKASPTAATSPPRRSPKPSSAPSPSRPRR